MRPRLLLPTSLRWLALTLALLGLVAAMPFTEDAIDRATQPLCPDGWWHTSPFWAHCAFPPISITKYAGAHIGACLASLLLVTALAPRAKWQFCSAVLLMYLLAPVAWMLFNRWSWSAGVAFGGVALLALVFGCGVYAARFTPRQPR